MSRTVYFEGPRRITVREEPTPAPGEGEALVATVVSAISAGTELLIYRGEAPEDLPGDEILPPLDGNLRFPLKYGYSSVGRVVDIGPGVAASWKDELVFAFHPHQTHFTSAVERLHPVPQGLSPEEAALLPNMETAVSLVMDGRPVIGERVVVFGQGVVGLLTTALLSRMPLAALVTLDRESVRRRASLDFGASDSLDPSSGDAEFKMAELLDDGADLSYELSGRPETLDQALRATGRNGRVVVGSWYGTRRAELDLGGRFHRSRIRLLSSQVSTLDPRWSGRWTKRRRLEVAWRMLGEVRAGALVTHRLPFERAAEAYDLLDRGGQGAIQVVLAV